MHRREIRLHFITEEQIIQRAERAILFYLVYGHFLSVDCKFDKATPAIKLVGADFPDIFGTTVWTFHPTSPYPFTELMAFPDAVRSSGYHNGTFADSHFRCARQPFATFDQIRDKSIGYFQP